MRVTVSSKMWDITVWTLKILNLKPYWTKVSAIWYGVAH